MISADLVCSARRLFFFSSRRRHTRCSRDWSSDVCSSDLFRGSASQKPIVAQGKSWRKRAIGNCPFQRKDSALGFQLNVIRGSQESPRQGGSLYREWLASGGAPFCGAGGGPFPENQEGDWRF